MVSLLLFAFSYDKRIESTDPANNGRTNQGLFPLYRTRAREEDARKGQGINVNHHKPNSSLVLVFERVCLDNNVDASSHLVHLLHLEPVEPSARHKVNGGYFADS